MAKILTQQNQLNMRSKARPGVDHLMFNNPDYLIYKKNATPIDQLRFAPDMIAIGAANLGLHHNVFESDEKFGEFLDEMQSMVNTKIEQLRKANREKNNGQTKTS